MDKDHIFQHAQLMFLNGAGRKAVMEYLTENGVPEAETGTMATEAYKAVREEIQQKKLESGQENANIGEDLENQKDGDGMGAITFGALALIVGIIATTHTDRIWYGAIMVGAISLISGLFKRLG